MTKINVEEFLHRAAELHSRLYATQAHWSEFEIRLITENTVLARHRTTQKEYVILAKQIIDVGLSRVA